MTRHVDYAFRIHTIGCFDFKHPTPKKTKKVARGLIDVPFKVTDSFFFFFDNKLTSSSYDDHCHELRMNDHRHRTGDA
jgi:hypothetical protein